MNAPKKEARTIGCKICGRRLEVTPGLPELDRHWTEEHPEELDRLRKKLGHEEDEG